MTTQTDRQNAVNAALDFVHVYTSDVTKQAAAAHILFDKELDDRMTWTSDRPATLFYESFEELYQESESDELATAMMDEYRSWMKQAREDVARVKEVGLPLTVRNVRAAFLHEGPFARKK